MIAKFLWYHQCYLILYPILFVSCKTLILIIDYLYLKFLYHKSFFFFLEYVIYVLMFAVLYLLNILFQIIIWLYLYLYFFKRLTTLFRFAWPKNCNINIHTIVETFLSRYSIRASSISKFSYINPSLLSLKFTISKPT